MNMVKPIVITLGVALLVWFIYQLAPVLTPFLTAATLAYLTDPLVERLSTGKYKIPRTLAVIGVFVLVLIVLFVAILFLIPAIQQQLVVLISKIPLMVEWIQKELLPSLTAFGITPHFDVESLKTEAMKHSQQATKLAQWLWQTAFHSSGVLLTWIMNILITFVAAFYLLRDWPKILTAVHSLFPRDIAPTVLRLAKRCDVVLSTFVRGQLSVMAVLGVIYSLGLEIVGVNFSLLLGMIAGFFSIVPYLGTVLGLGAALIVAYMQFQAWLPMVEVLIVFGLGHILEIMVLAPLLVGDKLGLHPVVVIFAVLAGGHLLGLVGVIIALPIAAILVVLARELLPQWSNQHN